MANSRWDKYRVNPPEPTNLPADSSNRWEKYRVSPPLEQIEPVVEEDQEWGPFLAKSALKGVSSLVDLPKNILQLGEGLKNFTEKYSPRASPNAPLGRFFSQEEYEPTDYTSSIPDTGDARRLIKDYTGVDLEPHAKSPEQRVIGNAAEFAGGFGPLGLAGKGMRVIDRFTKAGKLAGQGAGIGAVSGTLQEGGVDPLIGDVAGMVAMNPVASARGVGNVLARSSQKLMGLSPSKIKLEEALAARDLGIDLPAAVLTDSTVTGLADQFVSKTPFWGNRLKAKYKDVENKVGDTLENIYEGIGPMRSEAIDQEIANLYTKRANSLPQDAKVLPVNTIEALDNIKINSGLLSPEETKLLTDIKQLRAEFNPSLESSTYGKVKIPMQDYDVARLIGTKQSLNKIIKWDLDEGVRNQLRKVQHGINQDIAAYGQTNPEWFETFKEADKLFGDVARREKIENMLNVGQPVGAVSYNALAKNITTKKQIKILKQQLKADPETFNKIEKLGKVAEAMVVKTRNIPNPSATAATLATMGLIYGIAKHPAVLLQGGGIAGIVGTDIASRLLTNKKFLNSAIDYAHKPSLMKSFKVNKELEQLTGYSAMTLQKMMGE